MQAISGALQAVWMHVMSFGTQPALTVQSCTAAKRVCACEVPLSKQTWMQNSSPAHAWTHDNIALQDRVPVLQHASPTDQQVGDDSLQSTLPQLPSPWPSWSLSMQLEVQQALPYR
jgi:hypothetical protein